MIGRAAVLPVLAALLSSGCFTHTGRVDRLAHDLDRQLPSTRFEPNGGFKFGRISLGMAKGVARLAMDEEELEDFGVLRGLKRIELASYHTVGASSAELSGDLELSLRGAGWQTLARFRDQEARGWIVYRMQKGSLRKLVVCLLDEEELTLIHLSGRLDRLITSAIQLARSQLDAGDESDWVEKEPEPAG